MGKLHLCPIGYAGAYKIYSTSDKFLLSVLQSSGHMVPQFRPQAALHMLDKFLQNEMLSPLLPSNQTIGTSDEKDFKNMMEKWTESAKATPYVV